MPDVTLNLAPTFALPPITLTNGEGGVVLVNGNQGSVNVYLQSLLAGPQGPAGPVGPPDLGDQPYTAIIVPGTVTENVNGQMITSVFSSPGTIVATFGAPISEVWTTIISGGTITTSQTS